MCWYEKSGARTQRSLLGADIIITIPFAYASGFFVDLGRKLFSLFQKHSMDKSILERIKSDLPTLDMSSVADVQVEDTPSTSPQEVMDSIKEMLDNMEPVWLLALVKMILEYKTY